MVTYLRRVVFNGAVLTFAVLAIGTTLAIQSDVPLRLEATSGGVLAPVAHRLVPGPGGTLLAMTTNKTIVNPRSTSPLFSLAGVPGTPLLAALDVDGRLVVVTQQRGYVLNVSGQVLSDFGVPTATPTGLVVLGNGDIALAVSSASSRILVLGTTGERIAEFGDAKQLDPSNDQNRFLNQGVLLPGPDESLFFVFTHTPKAVVEHWSRTGQLLKEFTLLGAGIDRQGSAIARELSRRGSADSAGGLSTVTAAFSDREHGHLWFATTASDSATPNLFQYSPDGTKLAEYQLHTAEGYLPYVTDIAVVDNVVHVITQRSIYSFPLPRVTKVALAVSSRPWSVKVSSAIARLGYVHLVPAALAYYCGNDEGSPDCSRYCTVGPSVDCAASTFWPTGPEFRVVGHTCTTAPDDGGKCSLAVTTCSEATGNTNHGPRDLECPLDHDMDSHPATQDCDDNNPNIWRDCGEFGAVCNPVDNQCCDFMICGDSVRLCGHETPITFATSGHVQLSSRQDGVMFDFFGNGTPHMVPWPTSQDVVWLVLDKNADGSIDGIDELFGGGTRMANGERAANGFAALAEYDDNHDGMIDALDRVFSQLALWHDAIRDGVVESGELHPLGRDGIQSISLDYRESRRRDRWGNEFKLRAPVTFTRGRYRFAYDVTFVVD